MKPYSKLTRRELLQRGLGLAATASLGGLHLKASSAKLPVMPAMQARAKAIIQIWLWGGPAHLDTFDPKPEAGKDYCGPYANPIETNVSGIRINELLTQLARQADKYSLIRSMTHGINAHETAAYLTQTGYLLSRYVHPTLGAVVSYFKGERANYSGLVPPYVVLTRPQGRFSEAGFLGAAHKPFATGGDPNKPIFAVEGIVAEDVSDQRQNNRRKLLQGLDTLQQSMGESPLYHGYNQAQSEAYNMIFGDAKSLFNLGNEPEALRNRYGRNTFGQSCIMARRLVESGVPYVTINDAGWDTHKGHFGIMNRKLPELDMGVANLLQDLSARGLLESTIVWVGGEFGRAPKISWEPPWSGGRHHYGHCFSTLLAGGGFAGGQVVGASDERGEAVIERPVYPVDFLSSIYALMGINPNAELPNPHDVRLQVLPDPADPNVKQNGWLKEIMPSV